MKSRKTTENRNTKLVDGINHLSNYHQNPIKIEDLQEKTTGTDPFIFNLTMRVFEKIQMIHFSHEFEEKTMCKGPPKLKRIDNDCSDEQS
jgi:hypothetical protein